MSNPAEKLWRGPRRMPTDDWFGPWVPHLSDPERNARLAALRTLAVRLCGPTHILTRALDAAGTGDAAKLAQALAEVDRLPALRRRKLLSSYLLLSKQGR